MGQNFSYVQLLFNFQILKSNSTSELNYWREKEGSSDVNSYKIIATRMFLTTMKEKYCLRGKDGRGSNCPICSFSLVTGLRP